MKDNNIKNMIIDKINDTKELIEEYKELVKPIVPDCSLGRVSRMDAINNKSVVEASLLQAKNKLADLCRVLDTFGTDEFGRCIRCGSQIPIKRILFRPESLLCVSCAAKN